MPATKYWVGSEPNTKPEVSASHVELRTGVRSCNTQFRASTSLKGGLDIWQPAIGRDQKQLGYADKAQSKVSGDSEPLGATDSKA